MDETVHDTPMPALVPEGRRLASKLACTVFLVALLAAALYMMGWLEVPDRPLAGKQDELARLVRDYQGSSPSSSLEEILAHPDLIPTHQHPLVGRQAPDFALADAEGKIRHLGDFRSGGPVVVVFYYGYYCDHCVRQLFDINRDMPLFREVGARVVAISADPPELTRKRYQQYGSFGFTVLSDPDNQVAKTYQVFRQERLLHGTFVIDGDGTVVWVNVGDAPFRRNSALLCQLAQLVLRGGESP